MTSGRRVHRPFGRHATPPCGHVRPPFTWNAPALARRGGHTGRAVLVKATPTNGKRVRNHTMRLRTASTPSPAAVTTTTAVTVYLRVSMLGQTSTEEAICRASLHRLVSAQPLPAAPQSDRNATRMTPASRRSTDTWSGEAQKRSGMQGARTRRLWTCGSQQQPLCLQEHCADGLREAEPRK